jgi:hypothetical protein
MVVLVSFGLCKGVSGRRLWILSQAEASKAPFLTFLGWQLVFSYPSALYKLTIITQTRANPMLSKPSAGLID